MSKEELSQRKAQHIELALQSQIPTSSCNQRFDYEPLFAPHPHEYHQKEFSFAGKLMRAPLWISSMTGGTEMAKELNRLLAQVCAEFGLGMGLGSCRPLLNHGQSFDDFDLRGIIGEQLPFYANLGICQVEELWDQGAEQKIAQMVQDLRADGLIVHLNPLQEWFQPEGDRLKRPALEIIEQTLELGIPLMVKEVGQGMGPASLEALMRLPLQAIEFGAFGGTNFSYLELQREISSLKKSHQDLAYVGHDVEQMIRSVNSIFEKLGPAVKCREFVISGGVSSCFQGYDLIQRCSGVAVYGQAKAFLEHAQKGYEELRLFVQDQLWGLAMAESFLRPKSEG